MPKTYPVRFLLSICFIFFLISLSVASAFIPASIMMPQQPTLQTFPPETGDVAFFPQPKHVYSYLNFTVLYGTIGIAYLPVSDWMIYKVTMFERMAIRANDGKVFERIILAVAVFMVEAKNLRMLAVSAPLASVDRPSPLLEGSAESSVADSERIRGKATFSTAKSGLVRLPTHVSEVRSALLALRSYSWLLLQRCCGTAAFVRAILGRLGSNERGGAHYAISRMLWYVDPHLSLDGVVAILRAILGCITSTCSHIKLLTAGAASGVNPRREFILGAFRSSHFLILSNVNKNVKESYA